MCIAKNCTRPLFEENYCKTHSPRLQREARLKNPERFKGYSLQRDYGMSVVDYNDLLKNQGGLCAVCGVPDGSERSNNNGSKRLSVDHDHVTGAIRGLLCASCNQALGQMMDSSVLLRKAADYLDAHEKHSSFLAEEADLAINELINS